MAYAQERVGSCVVSLGVRLGEAKNIEVKPLLGIILCYRICNAWLEATVVCRGVSEGGYVCL